MQYVSDKLYHTLHYILVTVSGLVVAAYTGLHIWQPLGPGEYLGITEIPLVIAGVHILYAVFLYRYIARGSARSATYISLLLFTLYVTGVIHLTGNFDSPYFGVWLGLVVMAGMMGTYLLIGSAFMISIYYIMVCAANIPTGNPAHNCELFLLLSYIAATASYLIWQSHYRASKETVHVQQLSGQLSEEQLKSEILLRSIGDGVIIVSLDGKIQFINPAAQEITEWSGADAQNLDYQLVLQLTDEKNNQLRGQDDPFVRAFQHKENVQRNDIVLFTKSKRRKDLAITVSPIINADNVVAGGIAVFRDISEEKQLERERNEFISTASHEMRTPVASIEGYLALALNEKVSKIDKNARQYIEKAHNETRHLGNLFRDLLSVSKLEEDSLPSQPEPVDMNKVIEATIDEMRFAAEEKELELSFKSYNQVSGETSLKPLYYVYADPERLREVLTNLIDNAIKFTDTGKVEVTLNSDNNFVTVGVHDTGVGIPPEEVKHLFQKFYRIDDHKTRQSSGTGLGLYISRTIIEMFNGRMWVESTLGEGSHFYFSLPRMSTDRAQEMLRQQEKEQGAVQPGGNPQLQSGLELPPVNQTTGPDRTNRPPAPQ